MLTPVFSNRSTFFVPTQNEKLTSRLHPILTNAEIMNIIETTDELSQWIDNDSDRKDAFRAIVAGGEVRDIVSMLKSIIRHKAEVESVGKKLHKADEIAYKEAQKILYEEFAMVMDVSKDEVIDIICGKK